MQHLVISFICPDRPGIVNNLSALVKKHHGSWQASSMHNLSGFFAGIIEIAINKDHVDALITEIKTIENINIQTAVAAPKVENSAQTLVLELTANDRTGIIQDISKTIHHNNGNLLKLVSATDNAPHTGQLMFKAKATIAVIDEDIDKLISALENLADDLMVDIAR